MGLHEEGTIYVMDGLTLSVIGGLLVAIIIGIWRFFFVRREKSFSSVENVVDASPHQTQKTQNNNTQSVTINMDAHNAQDKELENPPESTVSPERVTSLRRNLQILFIDDDEESTTDKIKNIQEYGWERVKLITDAKDIFSADIREAEIIFVDFHGIGNDNPDQGLDVLSALKKQYGDTKWLILFTSYDVPVTTYDRGANDYALKNSTMYELERKIIKGATHLNK